ncbi:MAG TPA: type IX secretion system sortase PorU [Chitinophagaceae bacterium]|nr:type IX secretion system sortase PorU [Chitinophagaceae bacterium]
MIRKKILFGWLAWLLLVSINVRAQRNYAPGSVLASGNWYKLSVKHPGIYRIDLAFLNSLGISASAIPSASIRIFGNGGGMLPEANASPYTDDLVENAIQVVDGGDGMLNGADHILFFAAGPHHWKKDSANQRFIYSKNLYSEKSYYFLSIGGNGKRVATATPPPSAPVTVTSFSERFVHELDSINFLGSGKEWFGEEFANAPGKTLAHQFPVNLPGLAAGSTVTLVSDLVSRSVGNPGRFDVRINDQLLAQVQISAVSGGQYDPFAQQAQAVVSATGLQSPLSVRYNYFPGSFNAQGWLNRFQLFARCDISLSGRDQLLFRDWLSVGTQAAEFVVRGAGNSTSVWDVTDPLSPVLMPGTFAAGEFRFRNGCERLREYIAFSASNYLVPAAEGTVANQNLHASTPADLIVITHPNFLPQAQRLADLHRQRDGMRTVTATTEQVYHEFSGGIPDPAALRDFVRMYFDRYGSGPDRPRYLLLFGDGSYDYKDRIAGNTNFVPAYQSAASLDPLATYTSDDFFGFLENFEDINSGLVANTLDIGIGRVPCSRPEEAKNYVDKVVAYVDPANMGPWRNNITFIADDEDLNLHLQDAEVISATANSANPAFNQQKIYLDAFRQESGPGGSRYPQANQAIDNQVFNGTLIWNYNGHGGARRLAEETVLDQGIVDQWNNPGRLPLFITATCDFAPFDRPQLNSIGENILLRPRTGGIALTTTTRVVFAFSNRIINNNYLRIALQPDALGKYRTLGDAIKDAKNYTYQTSGDVNNNRKFALLGDPALTLAFPVMKVRATKLNGIPVSQQDTLSSMETAVIEGEVTDQQGNVLSNFNGRVYCSVFDKPQTVTTLGNDPGSLQQPFTVQSNILFRGKSSVSNGRFTFNFRVPRDINYQYGNGKLSFYAENAQTDAGGFFTGFIVGGTGSGSGDNQGPEIELFFNDETFVNGGLTNQQPLLIAKLADSSGINTAGTGIGHDIIATLDNDNSRFFVLNDFYEGELDSYQRGTVKFQLPALEPGPHSIRFKAWDVMNNSSEVTLQFIVAQDGDLELTRVLNYPNPFTTRTEFWFEHNMPGQELTATVQIFTLTGRVIKYMRKTINSPGNRSTELEWDGNDEFGNRVARGVYLYRLTLAAPGKKRKEKIEKLVIF